MVDGKMKLGLIADLHSNEPALKAVLDTLSFADRILCAGDIVGYYTDPNNVISNLLEHDVTYIVGNHDWYLDNPPDKPNQLLSQSIEFTRSVIIPSYRQLLADAPSQVQLEIDGIKMAMYHGSPWDSLEEYIYPDYPHFEKFADVESDVIVLGHTHYPMIRRINGRLLINPGSCGQPRDNDWRASCAILDTKSIDVSIIRVEYDVDQVIRSIQSFGLDMQFANALIRRYTKQID